MDSTDKAKDNDMIIRELQGANSSMYAENSMLRSELVFWKKLALQQLGVDTQKISDLVYTSGGMSVASATLTPRGRGY